MRKIVVVEKNKTLKETKIREFSLENLFKKANLKNNKDFMNRHTWKIKNYFISLYAKNSGRANNENTYELPPPIDSQLYFGKMLLVKHTEELISNSNVVDLTIEEWEKIYEKLYGGFVDLGQEDSYSDEEEIPEKFKTKEGYSKEDGFIVDDDEEEDEDYIPDDEEEYITDDDEGEYDSNAEETDGEEELDSEEFQSDENNSENNGDDSENNEDDSDNQEEEFESDEELSDIGSELSEESYIPE